MRHMHRAGLFNFGMAFGVGVERYLHGGDLFAPAIIGMIGFTIAIMTWASQ